MSGRIITINRLYGATGEDSEKHCPKDSESVSMTVNF